MPSWRAAPPALSPGVAAGEGCRASRRGILSRQSLSPDGPTEELVLPARLVVLVSGTGTNLQALLDACADPAYGADVVAVGADRDDIEGLARAQRAGLPTFVVRVPDHAQRDDWDAALTEAVAANQPDLVVSAGFMKIVGKRFLERFTMVNTHPALLPAFAGAHAVRDALDYGAKVTGCTVHLVDTGVDTGPVIAQAPVEVRPDDDEASLHTRIKDVERALLVDVVGRMSRGGWQVSGRKVHLK
ncbi:MAG: phosphoribosylglycinamide formyltransferase 1 [Frankiaceae bacterium]|nr:phosphoribosylglycinamide formyltransferase 1 [Frankiaceae bacterium]